MVGQRQRHAMAQLGSRKLVLRVQKNASVAAEAEYRRVELAEGLDQIGLAVEIDRVLTGGGFHKVDADRATAFRLRREIARLPHFRVSCSAPTPFVVFAV